MTTIPAAPLDPAQLALSLAPFGQSRMLPRDAYLSPDVLEWERRYLFDDWMCLGRSSEVARGGLRAESVGSYGVLLTRDGRACCARSRTRAATVATSCSRAGARPPARRPSSAPTTRGPTGTTAA